MSARRPKLEGLRGVAILLVLATHSFVDDWEGSLQEAGSMPLRCQRSWRGPALTCSLCYPAICSTFYSRIAYVLSSFPGSRVSNPAAGSAPKPWHNHAARASFTVAFRAVRAKFNVAREVSATLAGKIKK